MCRGDDGVAVPVVPISWVADDGSDVSEGELSEEEKHEAGDGDDDGNSDEFSDDYDDA